jgi:hypothetical protein
MSTERDIIIERLEQKLVARDAEFAKMQDTFKESIITEIEKRFADKIKLRESTLDEIKVKFGEKVNEILDMNKSLRDSIEHLKSGALTVDAERLSRIERRLIELNNAYDGVMKELLDQKSVIQEIAPKKSRKEELKSRNEIIIKEETKPASVVKPKPKNEYIVAENYEPRGSRKKEQTLIEAEEKPIPAEERKEERPQIKKSETKRSERVKEGVEIYETPKKR